MNTPLPILTSFSVSSRSRRSNRRQFTFSFNPRSFLILNDSFLFLSFASIKCCLNLFSNFKINESWPHLGFYLFIFYFITKLKAEKVFIINHKQIHNICSVIRVNRPFKCSSFKRCLLLFCLNNSKSEVVSISSLWLHSEKWFASSIEWIKIIWF